MKVYIAYKYTNIDNKDQTHEILESISNTLKEMGHETFILGRDVKHWKHVSLFRTIPLLIKNLRKNEVVVAYVDSDVASYGLLFETFASRIMGMPFVLILNTKAKGGIQKKMATKVLEVTEVSQIHDTLINNF